jgi:hypothetical protein
MAVRNSPPICRPWNLWPRDDRRVRHLPGFHTWHLFPMTRHSDHANTYVV